MGLRTRIKQKGKRVAKRVVRRFQGDTTQPSTPSSTIEVPQTRMREDVQRLAEELEQTNESHVSPPTESVAFQVDLPEVDTTRSVEEKHAPINDTPPEEPGPDATEENDSDVVSEETDWPPLLEGDEADSIRNNVIEQIQTIFDPEIPVNIHELGLIYEVNVHENMAVKVIMTLTSPNCPAAQSLPNEVKVKTEDLDVVTKAEVDVVWDPVWGPHLMTEEARLELNL